MSICKSKSPSSLNSRILLSYLGGITGSIVLLYCIVTRVEFVDGAVSKIMLVCEDIPTGIEMNYEWHLTTDF